MKCYPFTQVLLSSYVILYINNSLKQLYIADSFHICFYKNSTFTNLHRSLAAPVCFSAIMENFQTVKKSKDPCKCFKVNEGFPLN